MIPDKDWAYLVGMKINTLVVLTLINSISIIILAITIVVVIK